MKPLAIVLLLISTYCIGQQSTKEEFLNDVLQDTNYHLGDDDDHGKIVMDEACTYSNTCSGFNDYLPDSCYQQMLKTLKKDSGKVFHWNKTKLHTTSGRIFVITDDEADLILDIYTMHDTAGPIPYHDSIEKRKEAIIATRKKYHNATGCYFFHRPVFEVSCQYAIFSYGYVCDLVMCGSGACDLYKKVNGHWQKISDGVHFFN